ncbi:hypothetical protein LG634_09260 [Streptomyces bambusae]|uniref:hypothetical protein n=1 Tax=Streptomyces bambusae TaxID=1550616 RepID=UPI001CFD5F18|nr:hypothetical protein [Streptomyces bambusae]MCB5165014.1 hypothetical protein [Streptomyces bambusae]
MTGDGTEAVQIVGYDDVPVVPGESLLDRPGFWPVHLLAMCGDGACDERPDPEWFGDDGADVDALSEVLFDPEHWPAFRVPAADGPGVVVLYRNLDGDCDTDYLPMSPGGSDGRQTAGRGSEPSATGLTWNELIRLADNPPSDAEGVQDPACRLLLLLPLCAEAEVPEAAPERLTAALTAVGAPEDTVSTTVQHLLFHLTGSPQHDPAWTSPLTGT